MDTEIDWGRFAILSLIVLKIEKLFISQLQEEWSLICPEDVHNDSFD